VRIYKVGDDNAAMLDYLADHGLVPGRCLEVREARAVDGVVVVEDEDGGEHPIGAPLARQIFVRSASGAGRRP
jgi:hypothetical protein